MSAYTPKVEAQMREIGNFTRVTAEKFADDLGVSLKSVIAKISRMDGVTYTKPTGTATLPAKRKTEVVANIEALLDADKDHFWGLERSTVKSLDNLEQRVATVLEQWEDQYMQDVETALSGEVPEYFALCSSSDDGEVEEADSETAQA